MKRYTSSCSSNSAAAAGRRDAR